jgi:RNA polymerase sigma-70 factor, ECF subfamily
MKTGQAKETADEILLETYRREPESPAGRRAISELFERYRMPLYHWCLRYVRSHEPALDLAQETMMEAFRALPGFEGRSKFASWLFAIARYRCISAVRASKPFLDDESELELLPATGPDPEEEVLAGMEEDRALKVVQETLDPLEQQAIWLRCYEEMPVPEITRVLGIQERSGARGVLQRARRKLRAAFTESSGPRGGGQP